MSTETPYPIQLEQVLFTKCSVIAVPDHVPVEGQEVAMPVNQISVIPNPDTDQKRSFIVQMNTVINPEMDKLSPYSIVVECFAQMRASEELSDEEALKGVTINGHSVCYGAIRETVAWLTSRQPYGPLMLGMSVLRAATAKQKGSK